ncbi:MAG: two-component regulator propeller domain-containing protein [Bacteroidia bacterium]|nr:two-component regulator propeller domain-containing protein [Bacteroidia bacterium]
MKRILFLGLCLGLLTTGHTQIKQVYTITRYSTADGLIQSQVMALLQDRMGYLWLGTHRGADRYDGYQFSHIGQEGDISGYFLSDLLEDRRGQIWMASDNGITVYDGQTFRTISTREGLPESNIRCLIEAPDGTIWVGGQSKGVARYQHNTWTQVPLPEQDKVVSVEALAYGSDQALWIGTLQGLFQHTPDGRVRRVEPRPGGGKEIHSLLCDKTGTLWVGAREGLYCLRGDVWQFFDPREAGISDPTVFCLTQDTRQIWAGTGSGIVRLLDDHMIPLSDRGHTRAYSMRSATVDHEGNVWFGTDGGGVLKITEGVFERYTMDDGLTSNLAKSFLEDDQGRIWISTKDRGISVYQGDKRVATYTEDQGLGGNAICYSYRDQAGHFWFASYNGTLTRWDGSRMRVYNNNDGLRCNSVFCVDQSPEGLIRVGTDNGIYILRGDQFKYWTQAEKTIYAIRDHRDTTWVGTAQGLVLIPKKADPTPIPSYDVVGNNVITLLEDMDGRMWVGSSAGLTCLGQGRPVQIPISGAPGANTVVGLTLEARRYLWVATENGAYRLDLRQWNGSSRARFEHFAQRDGFPSLECNANAAFEDSQGHIWIGTAEGAVHRPSQQADIRPAIKPRLMITRVQAGSASSWTSLGYQVDSLGLPVNLRLSHRENRLVFDFIGISFRNGAQIEYRYQLQGLDKNWSDPQRQPQVSIPNLRPGKFTFVVQAQVETQGWTDVPQASFSFEILPPFWQTWWFVLLMAALVGIIGWYVYFTITERRRRAQEETRIRNTAEKLRLEHQALYAMMNPHFTFNALQSIQYFIHSQDKLAASRFLSSFAKLVRLNLESTKQDFISLAQEVERLKIYLSLEKMRFPEKFDYVVEMDPALDSSEIQLPPMILQPFVENSIKHGVMSLEQGGMIRIAIQPAGEEHLRILIEDNGIGIEASRARRENRPNDHVSRGMQITLDRLALFARMTQRQYDLQIGEIRDAQGQSTGTRVEMLLPRMDESDAVFQ